MKSVLLVFSLLVVFDYSAQDDWYVNPILEVYDYIKFDSISPSISYNSSTDDLWQVGEPSKFVFDSAYSPANALMTDTANTYPNNNYSYFDVLLGDFNFEGNQYYDVFIEFKHRFDTDSLKDGGYISVSYDEGETFANIIFDDPFCFDISPGDGYYDQTGLYAVEDTLINGEPGYSGSSGEDWITTGMSWQILPVRSVLDCSYDTLIVRFNFISDNVDTEKDGWMIDDIKLFACEFGSSIYEIDNTLFELYPNPTYDICNIVFDNGYIRAHVELYDSRMRLLLVDNVKGGFRIDMTQYPVGIYTIVVVSDDGLGFSERIVRE